MQTIVSQQDKKGEEFAIFKTRRSPESLTSDENNNSFASNDQYNTWQYIQVKTKKVKLSGEVLTMIALNDMTQYIENIKLQNTIDTHK